MILHMSRQLSKIVTCVYLNVVRKDNFFHDLDNGLVNPYWADSWCAIHTSKEFLLRFGHYYNVEDGIFLISRSIEPKYQIQIQMSPNGFETRQSHP